MNKKLEDAAKKYIETGRGFDMDSLSDTIKKVIFKDGAEWALREAIEQENQHLKSQLALCVEALETFAVQENYFHDYYLFQEEINKKAQECLDKLAAMQSEGEK